MIILTKITKSASRSQVWPEIGPLSGPIPRSIALSGLRGPDLLPPESAHFVKNGKNTPDRPTKFLTKSGLFGQIWPKSASLVKSTIFDQTDPDLCRSVGPLAP